MANNMYQRERRVLDYADARTNCHPQRLRPQESGGRVAASAAAIAAAFAAARPPVLVWLRPLVVDKVGVAGAAPGAEATSYGCGRRID